MISYLKTSSLLMPSPWSPSSLLSGDSLPVPLRRAALAADAPVVVLRLSNSLI